MTVRMLLLTILAAVVTPMLAAEIDGKIPNVEEVTEGIEAFLRTRHTVLLTVYAPWCEYSKALVGPLRTVADIVNSDPIAKSKVSVAKLDGNFYGGDTAALGINSYPQVILFKAGVPKLYNGPKAAPPLIQFINSETGLDLQPTKGGAKSKDIRIITDDSIDSIIDSDRYVVLQVLSRTSKMAQEVAGWYQTLTDTFINEPSIVIAAMEAERNPKSAKQFKVDPKVPKVIILHKGKQYPFTEPELTPGSLVYFINKVAGTQRNVDGTLNTKAGRIAELHAAVRGNAFKGTLMHQAMTQTEAFLKAHPKNKDAALYLRIIQKVIEKGPKWVTGEITRLAGLVQAGSVTPEKLDLFTKRLNILNSMLPMEDDAADHLEEL